MPPRKTILALIFTGALWLASCGTPNQAALTETATPPALATHTPPPIPTQTHTATQTPTQTPGITPTLTFTPEVTPSVAPACFTPADFNLLAFMPDGERILVKTMDGVQIFNLKTLQEDGLIKAPRNILAAAISPDGETLAWSLDDNTLQLVQIADGQVVSIMPGHTNMVGKLRFSPSGDRLYSASHDSWVRVWDKEGNQVDAFQPLGADFPSEVLGIGISPDGTQLASVPFDGPVKIWDLATKQLVATLGGGGGFDTSDAVFSPDGRYLAADLASGLYLWNLADGKSVWAAPVNSMAVAFSPNGRYLAYDLTEEASNIVIASPDGAQTLRILRGHPGRVWELVFSPDSRLLASTDGGELRVWRVEDGALLYVGKASCP